MLFCLCCGSSPWFFQSIVFQGDFFSTPVKLFCLEQTSIRKNILLFNWLHADCGRLKAVNMPNFLTHGDHKMIFHQKVIFVCIGELLNVWVIFNIAFVSSCEVFELTMFIIYFCVLCFRVFSFFILCWNKVFVAAICVMRWNQLDICEQQKKKFWKGNIEEGGENTRDKTRGYFSTAFDVQTLSES
jgi:hypothetical protein